MVHWNATPIIWVDVQLVHHCTLFGIISLLQWCATYDSNMEKSFIEHGKTPDKGKGKSHELAYHVVAHCNIRVIEDLFNDSLAS